MNSFSFDKSFIVEKTDKTFYLKHKKQLDGLNDYIQKAIIFYSQRFSCVKYKNFSFDNETYIFGLADTIGYSTICGIPDFFEDESLLEDIVFFCSRVFFPFYAEIFNSNATKDLGKIIHYCCKSVSNYIDISIGDIKIPKTKYDSFILSLGQIDSLLHVYLSRLLNAALSCKYSNAKDKDLLNEIYDILRDIVNI